MTVKNLLIWNSNPHPRLTGYTVTPSSGGTFSVPSNMFVDPQVFADEAAAAAVIYTVSAVTGSAGPKPEDYMIPEPPTLRVQTWPIPDLPLCALSGNITNVSAFLELRSEVRFSPMFRDIPLLGPAGYIGSDSVSVFTNYRGDFLVYLIQGIPVLIHMPNVASAARVFIPQDSTANLKDLPIEPHVLYRNN